MPQTRPEPPLTLTQTHTPIPNPRTIVALGAKSKLHGLSWFRVILDEAHMIKDRSSKTAHAVFNLVSVYKWCLTGTPLQNRVSELFSQVHQP